LASQNVFMSVILNHYESRMLLYRELGIMELDDCGIWIDKPISESDWLTEDQCPVPPAVPQEWLDEADVNSEDVEAYASKMAEAGNLDPGDVDLMALPQGEDESGDAADGPRETASGRLLSLLPLAGASREDEQAQQRQSPSQSRRPAEGDPGMARRQQREIPLPPETYDDADLETAPGPELRVPASPMDSGPKLRR
jgi:hypothetical protein